jgi:hypothetical protein
VVMIAHGLYDFVLLVYLLRSTTVRSPAPTA